MPLRAETLFKSALPSIIGVLAVTELVVALLLGGGTFQGLWSDAIVELFAIPLIFLTFLREPSVFAIRELRTPLAIFAVILLIFALQLVPLPPAIWTALPGRGLVTAAYRAADVAPAWAPISLDPQATWFSLLSLLPALALFLAAACGGRGVRRILTLIILGFAFANVLLGLAQIAGGPDSSLRFYNPTNVDNSVGFFANRNHYAAMLYLSIAFAAAWFVGLLSATQMKTAAALVVLAPVYAFLLLGLGMAHSRAGLALAFLTGALSAVLFWRSSRNRTAPWRKRATIFLIVGTACGLALAFQFGFVGFADRFENGSALEDLRWTIARVAMHGLISNLPFGVGMGAFEPVYQSFEASAIVIPEYVNHAHDDWIEIVFDGGLPALAALVAFLVWYVRRCAAVWKPTSTSLDAALARAGSIVVFVLLLHSVLDYPLRTLALMSVFACSCALVIPLRDGEEEARDFHGGVSERRRILRRTR